MSKVLRLAIVAWAWWQNFKTKAFAMFLEKIVIEVSKKSKVSKDKVAPAGREVMTLVSEGNYQTAFGKFRALISDNWSLALNVLLGCLTASELVNIYSIYEKMEEDKIPDEQIPVYIHSYVDEKGKALQQSTSSSSEIVRSFQSYVDEVGDYAEEHGVEAAIERYSSHPIVGQVVSEASKTLGYTIAQPNCSTLMQASLEINKRRAKAQRFADMLGLSKGVAYEFYLLLRELNEEDFLL